MKSPWFIYFSPSKLNFWKGYECYVAGGYSYLVRFNIVQLIIRKQWEHELLGLVRHERHLMWNLEIILVYDNRLSKICNILLFCRVINNNMAAIRIFCLVPSLIMAANGPTGTRNVIFCVNVGHKHSYKPSVKYCLLHTWQCKSSIFCVITPWKSTDISEEYVASIFKVEEYPKQETSMKQIAGSATLRWHVPLKSQLTFSGLHSVIT
jgi:hypothetical protein